MSIETKALAEKAERLAGQKTLLDWIGSFGSEDIGVDIGTSKYFLVSMRASSGECMVK